MALTYRALYRNCNFIRNNITKPVKWTVEINYSARVLASGICYQRKSSSPFHDVKLLGLAGSFRTYSTQDNPKSSDAPDPPKLGLIQRFKQMYRDYWYVLLPVHMATSVVWYGSAYYIVRSGVDVIAMLQSLGISERLLSPLRESGAGYFALALALYKIATPLRYTVTLGGTTYAIKKLQALGWLKPVPSKERLKEMYQEKRDNLQDRYNVSKSHYQTQMKQKRSHVMDEMKRYRAEIRSLKNKVKKM